jgi:adenine-specific DNA-methyltransferase
MAKKQTSSKTVEAIKHNEATRKNIPTAEYQSVLQENEQNPVRIAYERRNRDLDPQLVWRGKDQQDWSDLVVHAPPLYIQEKVHPKALIDDLLKQTRESEHEAGQITPDLFSDFNGIPKGVDKTEFYQHDQNWSNRMILGDSLQVMASLAEREGLRGKVQCIYFDPPYGIKFNSNFQWSTTSRDVKDGKLDQITREPEQVKAFRDTWRDGIHSYLTYLRDRLTVARDLLTESGSIFVQIGDENVHRVRALMDEVFGEHNFQSLIAVTKTAGGLTSTKSVPSRLDYIIAYSRNAEFVKYRQLYFRRTNDVDAGFTQIQMPDGSIRPLTKEEKDGETSLPEGGKLFRSDSLTKPGPGSKYDIEFLGTTYTSGNRWWGSPKASLEKLLRIGRVRPFGNTLRFMKYLEDFPYKPLNNLWDGLAGAKDIVYVVQTNEELVKRCLLMATDPGDLVLDPTCGSGTTAFVSEQWGRRWITIDTSRVALALARARIMGARYPFYLLLDSREGQIKEAEITHATPSSKPTHGNIRHGFVCERANHVTLAAIANNAELDVIWEKWQAKMEPLRKKLNSILSKKWEDSEIPRDISDILGEGFQKVVLTVSPSEAKRIHSEWWECRLALQKEIDASIAAKADFEYLYDRPYEDKKKARVAGPFTVESLSPHRVLGVDENDELIDSAAKIGNAKEEKNSFSQMILENLKTAGVQQAHKEDKIIFSALTPWPGDLVCADGRYLEGDIEKRAAIFIGPEFGTVQRADLVEAAKEAGDAGFDVLIACAFNYEAHATEFNKLGRIPVLKARMNADLHMSDDLKNTGKGNLFVVFGEPDIDIIPATTGEIKVKVNGVDVFHPNTGEVRSDGADGIACWFIDTDYNEESFFVRHAYFLGANDPYSSLKITLKTEINADAWATLNSDTSRPFPKPKSGRIAVKVINHLGDEVMKVFKIQ